MDERHMGQIALALLSFLEQRQYVLMTYRGFEPSVSYLERVNVSRMELHSFGNAGQMTELGLKEALSDERRGQIAYAVLKAELGCHDLDLRGKLDDVARETGVQRVDLDKFLICVMRHFAGECARAA